MKVLFINTFLSKGAIYREPLGIMSLISAVNHKHKVFILEPIRENIHERICQIKPDVIAYSLRTGFHQYYIDLNKKLKKVYNFISVFGGPHVTFFPQMINQEGVDCICKGESEEAFLEFLDVLESKKDYTKIKNFWVKKSGKIYKNSLRPLVQDLDTLKFPNRSLFDKYKEIKDAKVRTFITGRGCPFNCSYCFNAGLKGLYKGQNYVRRRSVKNVIDEVKEVKEKYCFEIAFFEDDTFNINKQWLREFSREFKKLNLKFICVGIRADLFDEETAKLLKEANCIGVVFGVESGNEIIRRKILNKYLSDKQIINCARLLKKYRIPFMTNNLLAIPTSSLEDDLKTLKLNIVCRPDYGVVCILQPYPGTQIYKLAVDQGLCNEDPFDNLGDFYVESNLKIENKFERENLQRLFALTIRFPFIYPHIRWLIKLRLRFLYSLLDNVYKAYFGIKWLPYKRSVGEYFSLFKRYFKL